LRPCEQILVEIVLFERRVVNLSVNFRGKGWSSTNEFWRQKESLSYEVALYT